MLTTPALVVLGAAALALFFFLARHPLAAVFIAPASAAVALLPVPGLPFGVLVAHGLAALAIGATLSHLILYPDSSAVSFPSGWSLVACGWVVMFALVVLISSVLSVDP